MDDTAYLVGVSRVATALRVLREERLGLSQRDFGARVGLSQARVSTYENGEKVPTKEVVQRIADRLGVDAREVDPEGEAYTPTAPRRRLQESAHRAHTRQEARKEVSMDDPRRYEFVSLFDSLVRNPTAQEELVTVVRRFVARKMLGNG